MSNLSTLSCLIIDRGELSHVAEFMGRYLKKVYFHCTTKEPYPNSPQGRIGDGLDNVTWVEHIRPVLKKIDFVFFPDVYDRDLMGIMQDLEIPVCGCLGAAKMELDKAYFMDVCEEAGLLVPHTERAEGLDDLWEKVKDKPGPLYLISLEPERGDWETFKHMNRYATKLFLDSKRSKLGIARSEAIQIGIRRPIEKLCEIGIDGFRLNGSLPQIPCGYEEKDAGIIEKVFQELPPILDDVMSKLAPEYNRLHCQGPYSSELIITPSGQVVPIDETHRCGSPTTGAIMEMYGEKYAEMIHALSGGKMIEVKDYDPYGAELVLSSEWYLTNELHVGGPKEIFPHLRLKNGHKRGGQYYCVPNGCGRIFGTLAASGKTPKQAYEKVLEMAEQLDIHQLEYKETTFEACEEAIKKGAKYGITF